MKVSDFQKKKKINLIQAVWNILSLNCLFFKNKEHLHKKYTLQQINLKIYIFSTTISSMWANKIWQNKWLSPTSLFLIYNSTDLCKRREKRTQVPVSTLVAAHEPVNCTSFQNGKADFSLVSAWIHVWTSVFNNFWTLLLRLAFLLLPTINPYRTALVEYQENTQKKQQHLIVLIKLPLFPSGNFVNGGQLASHTACWHDASIREYRWWEHFVPPSWLILGTEVLIPPFHLWCHFPRWNRNTMKTLKFWMALLML